MALLNYNTDWSNNKEQWLIEQATVVNTVLSATGVGQKTLYIYIYRGAGKSLARPWRKQATAAEDFDVHISYL
jgi:hypothetical protein